MGSYYNTAIVFGSLKEALLYYEHIIPLNVAGQFMGYKLAETTTGDLGEQYKEPSMEGHKELVALSEETNNFLDLYPPNLRGESFKNAANAFDGLLFAHLIRNLEGEETFRGYLKNLGKIVNARSEPDISLFRPSVDQLRELFSYLVSNFNLSDIPIDCSRFRELNNEKTSSVNTIQTSGIQIIDTSKLNFTQIMEARKDPELMRQMRRFRLFAYENYEGREKAFIEDDIQRRLDDYLEAIKSTGFETTIKAISFVFDSKLILSSLATSAAALLMGNPQMALGAFSAGTALGLGKLSLEYAKQQQAVAEICRDNPVSYIDTVKKRLSA